MEIQKINPNYFSVKNGKYILYGKGKVKIISPLLIVNQSVYENENGKSILDCSFADINNQESREFIEKIKNIEHKILPNISSEKNTLYSSLNMLETGRIDFLIRERFRRLEVDVVSETADIYLPTIWDVKSGMTIRVIFEISSVNENENWIGMSKICRDIMIYNGGAS